MVIDYNNLYKLRINNSKESTLKHDVIKLIILKKLLKKYKSSRKYVHIYTEFTLTNKDKSKKTDLLLLNFKTKEAYSYEIQVKINDEWLNETNKFYKDWDYPMMRTSDMIIIPVKELSDDIYALNGQLEKYIV